jgi:MFS-type transporter involved in bile tolerance (Atg22 family)
MFAVNALLMFKMHETSPCSSDSNLLMDIIPKLKPDVHIPGFSLFMGANFLFCLSMAGIELMLPFFLRFQFNLDSSMIGLIFLYIGVIAALGQGIIIRYFLTRISEKTIALCGFLIIPIPLILATGISQILIQTLILIFPITIGISQIGPSLSGMLSKAAPPERQGYVLGLFNSYGSIAYAIGPIASALIYGSRGITVSTGVVSLLLIVGAVLVWHIGRHTAQK